MIGALRRRRLCTPAQRLDGLPASELPGGLCVHEARGFAERRDGLAGLDDLPHDRGLRITPCWSIHTFGMRFALDLLWLDDDDRVVRLDHDVQPWRVRTCIGASSVVEVRAGEGPRFAQAYSSTTMSSPSATMGRPSTS